MGRSTGYCLKIIACGGTSESVDRDDLDASSENKATPDKRGWSFRKKPSGHRVLNNTIITETQTPSSDDKKISEPVIINSEPPVNSSESEKTSTNQWTEEFSRVSTSTTNDNTTPSKLVTKADDIKSDSSHDESSSIIVIQTAVRKFLGEREYLRLKNVVKLQAAVRGHLVRCHAAGALRCIHAIVKMQALVRVRYSKRLSLGEKGIQSSNMKPHPTYISIEKLLSNRFANQLTESTPRTKQINIKCDPSKQDQTWKWLERWMSVSVPSPEVKLDETDTKRLTLTTGSTSPETTIPEAEPPKRTPKRVATEPADSDGRKSAFGSRKASNPSFVAAQSKFEELTLTLTLTSKTATEPVAQTTSPLVYESLKVGSECGTELSVTSMLDSPDPSESGTTKPPDTELTHSVQDHDLLGTELTHSISILPEPSESEQEQERTPLTRPDKKREKPKSWANSKKSPISRGSLENLHSNRRNSFGSQTSEIEQEGRDSSSSSYSVPSYMQVTESARLKALNSSPRLSPQVQGNMKKRHSLPTAGLNGAGRHGSPRLKRSSPQSQPTTKGNDNRGERKWQN